MGKSYCDGNTVTKNLIDSMLQYADTNFILDCDAMDALVKVGVTKTDFIEAGYDDIAEMYFHR